MEDKNDQIFNSCLKKQQILKQRFLGCSQEQKYEKIIELGRLLPKIEESEKIAENIVKGCQSIVYLSVELVKGKLKFTASSDALISSGLAMLLIQIYDEEPPETVLQCPPLFLDELGIHASLTPGRSSGLSNIYLRMKQEALKFLVASHKTEHPL